MAWLGDKLKAGLAKTRKGLLSRLEDILPRGRSVDTDLLEDLEDALLGADVGLSTAEELLDRVKESAKGSVTADDLREMLRRELLDVLSVGGSGSAVAGSSRAAAHDSRPASSDQALQASPGVGPAEGPQISPRPDSSSGGSSEERQSLADQKQVVSEDLRTDSRGPQALAGGPEGRVRERRPSDGMPQSPAEEPLLTSATTEAFYEKPQVILVVGVNGAGKTTTIGKLAWRWANQGKKVMVAASDTFRAGAVEQLDQWIKRAGGEIVRQQRGADPAAVAFDALQAAKARGCDYLLVDTAGRLHTKANLMEELKKIGRVLGRLSPGAPHRVLLVLDATAGQNALIQAREFGEASGVTGIVVAKLDGTARGGAVIAIARELSVPVEMLGVGEGPEDLTDFDPEGFVDALLAP